MIKHAFGLSHDPFDRDIDTPDLFDSEGLRELDARLRYLLELQGVGLVTGEVGSGKTTAVRRLCESLHPGTHKAVYVCPSTVNTMDLYRTIALGLGLEPAKNRVRLFHQIRDEVERLVGAKKLRPVLVIDEVQLLRNDVLDDLRMLTNYRMDSVNLLTVVLVGQTEFRRKLAFVAHEAFAQRLAVRYHLDGIRRAEVSPFLAHRLRRAGVHHALFSEAAANALFEASKGTLRLLNLLARQIGSSIDLAALTRRCGQLPQPAEPSVGGQDARGGRSPVCLQAGLLPLRASSAGDVGTLGPEWTLLLWMVRPGRTGAFQSAGPLSASRPPSLNTLPKTSWQVVSSADSFGVIAAGCWSWASARSRAMGSQPSGRSAFPGARRPPSAHPAWGRRR